MNSICILSNNQMITNYVVRKLPKEKINLDLVIINDNRISKRIKWNTEIFNKVRYLEGSRVMKWGLENMNLTTKGEYILKKHIFSIKLLMIPFLQMHYDTTLFLDDDIYIFKNPIDLFKSNYIFFNEGFNKFDEKEKNEKSTALYYAYLDIFDLKLSIKEYNKLTINAGQMILSKDKNFLKYLENFFNNEIIFRVMMGRAKWRIFFLEQFFKNFYYYKLKERNKKIRLFTSDEAKFIVSKWKEDFGNSKMKKVPILLHIGTQSSKLNYFEHFDKTICL